MVTRRRILATTGVTFAGSLAGCLDREPGIEADRITPTSRESTGTEEDCGPAAQPLSALLSEDAGDSEHCFDGATPSFAVENERGEAVTVDFDLETENGFAETYDLDAGERAVESSAFESQQRIAGTVHVDGVGWTVEWSERSCRRYGVAVVPYGVEIGWIEPLEGPGDTQHDCYPWAPIPVEVGSAGEGRTVAVTITDLCAETAIEETIEIATDDRERIDDALVSGGVYDVTVDVDGGDSRTRELRDVCWGVVAAISETGEIRIEQLPID